MEFFKCYALIVQVGLINSYSFHHHIKQPGVTSPAIMEGKHGLASVCLVGILPIYKFVDVVVSGHWLCAQYRSHVFAVNLRSVLFQELVG